MLYKKEAPIKLQVSMETTSIEAAIIKCLNNNIGISIPYWVVIAIFIVYVIYKFYLQPYITEKGKNLATREDIEEITNKIESVRSDYAKEIEFVRAKNTELIEELKARHQLRMAAIDRRLQAHQEAFEYWRKLQNADDLGRALMECQTWWEKNCLYLEPAVRDGFVRAYHAEHQRNEFVRVQADSKLIIECWNEFRAFPNILFKAVKLPALTDLEAKVIGVSDEPGG